VPPPPTVVDPPRPRRPRRTDHASHTISTTTDTPETLASTLRSVAAWLKLAAGRLEVAEAVAAATVEGELPVAVVPSWAIAGQ
jgi:hypothetical protein